MAEPSETQPQPVDKLRLGDDAGGDGASPRASRGLVGVLASIPRLLAIMLGDAAAVTVKTLGLVVLLLIGLPLLAIPAFVLAPIALVGYVASIPLGGVYRF